METPAIHPPDPNDYCADPALSLPIQEQLLTAAKGVPDERGRSEGALYGLFLEGPTSRKAPL